MKTKKKKDNTWKILDKAWKIQSKALRSEGRCVGCGSNKGLVAGHLCHGGRGKAWNRIDFNVLLPVPNIFCQCSYCNTYDPDGNGKLMRMFFGKYANPEAFLTNIKRQKQMVWKPTEEDAEAILKATIERYGNEDV